MLHTLRLMCLTGLLAAASSSLVQSAELTPAQAALSQKARKECAGPAYSNAQPVINYQQMTFRCQEMGARH